MSQSLQLTLRLLGYHTYQFVAHSIKNCTCEAMLKIPHNSISPTTLLGTINMA